MEKLLENISKQLEELIKLNKNKDNEIDKLKKENKELKENMNKVKSYEILSKIEVPIDNRIEKANKNIEILIDNYLDYKANSIIGLCPYYGCECETDEKENKVDCYKCKKNYIEKLRKEMLGEYLV